MADENISNILSDFVKQYYLQKEELPSKIMMQEDIEDKEIIERILTEKSGKKVEFKTPQKGEKLRFVEMAVNNAKITLENKTKEKNDYSFRVKASIKSRKITKKN